MQSFQQRNDQKQIELGVFMYFLIFLVGFFVPMPILVHHDKWIFIFAPIIPSTFILLLGSYYGVLFYLIAYNLAFIKVAMLNNTEFMKNKSLTVCGIFIISLLPIIFAVQDGRFGVLYNFYTATIHVLMCSFFRCH